MGAYLRKAVFPLTLTMYQMAGLCRRLRIPKNFLFHPIARLFAFQFGAQEITPEQFLQRMKAQKPTLIFDVRTPAEQAISIIPHAICVQTSTDLVYTAEYEDFYKKHQKHLSECLIVTYCGGGYRGSQAIERFLKDQPIPAFNLQGGIVGYANACGPLIEPESRRPTQKVHAYSKTWASFVKPPYEGVGF